VYLYDCINEQSRGVVEAEDFIRRSYKMKSLTTTYLRMEVEYVVIAIYGIQYPSNSGGHHTTTSHSKTTQKGKVDSTTDIHKQLAWKVREKEYTGFDFATIYIQDVKVKSGNTWVYIPEL
jgi:hypothetical protein